MDFGPATASDRRSSQRYSCRSAARVRAKKFDFSCRIVDISATGAKVAIDPSLIASFREEQWYLVVDHIGSISAKKVWQRGSEFGLTFQNSAGKQVALEKTLKALAAAGTIHLLND